MSELDKMNDSPGVTNMTLEMAQKEDGSPVIVWSVYLLDGSQPLRMFIDKPEGITNIAGFWRMMTPVILLEWQKMESQMELQQKQETNHTIRSLEVELGLPHEKTNEEVTRDYDAKIHKMLGGLDE